MNTNPSATRILCYGDSNTWGYDPNNGRRYPINKRWTGIVQEILGAKYEVIEEGLNGRTTDLDDPSHEGMNGLNYLLVCLKSHFPLDYIVIMLGSNDLKTRFNRKARSISTGIQKIIQKVRRVCIAEGYSIPKIVIINPPIVDERMCNLAQTFEGAYEKSKKLSDLYADMSINEKCILLDLQKSVGTSKLDGFHLDEEGHVTIGKMVSHAILST